MSHAAGIDRGNRRMCSRNTSMARSSWPSAMNTRASSVTCDSSETANASTAMSSGGRSARFLSGDRRRRLRHGSRESGSRVAQYRGGCLQCPVRAGRRRPGGTPLVLVRRASPTLPQEDGRDQQRQENEGGDQRRIVVPPIASWRGRRPFLRFPGRRLRRFRASPWPFRARPWWVRMRAFTGSDDALAGSDGSRGRVRRLGCGGRAWACFRSRPLRGFLRADFLLHAFYERGELHDALAQDLRLGFDRGRLFLLRLFAVRRGGAATGHRTSARHWTTKAEAAPAATAGGVSARLSQRRDFSAVPLRVASEASAGAAGAPADAVRVEGRTAGRTGRLDSRAAGAGRGATTASRGAASAATTGVSIAGGSMNSVYSRRTADSQPACIVRRTTGSFTGRGLVMTRLVPAERALHVHPAEQELRDAVRVLLRRCNPEAFGRHRLAFAERHRNDHAQ